MITATLSDRIRFKINLSKLVFHTECLRNVFTAQEASVYIGPESHPKGIK